VTFPVKLQSIVVNKLSQNCDRHVYVALAGEGAGWACTRGGFAKPLEATVMKLVLALFAAVLATASASADEYGLATYYYNPYHGGLIAAHRTLPFGTRVRVNNLDNGRSTIVTIVDRGPWARGRIIDVSTVAADVLGMRRAGVAHVRLERF
jgi:rare lipoprotein A